jgi:hypothetical protein
MATAQSIWAGVYKPGFSKVSTWTPGVGISLGPVPALRATLDHLALAGERARLLISEDRGPVALAMPLLRLAQDVLDAHGPGHGK